jgi:DNA polymerase III subunit delta
MILNSVEFAKIIGKKPLPVTILFGPGKALFNKEPFEPFLMETALEKLLAAYVDPSMKDLAFSAFYAEETAPGAVVEEVRTVPFLAERRVVLVRNADVYMAMSGDKRSPLQPLLQFVEAPTDTSLLILISPSANKQKQLYKLCEKHGLIVECPQMDDNTYASWIREQTEQNGNAIAPRAVKLLMERVGGKMAEMRNAINLVCNYVGAGNMVDEEHVAAACADVAEATVWALTDAIASSNPAAALESLHDLLALNKSPDEIIGTINWLLESAYRAHPETSLELGKPFVEKKVAPLARKFSPKRLAGALAMCSKTHFSLRNTGVDTHLLLELLIIKLAWAKK